VAQSGISWGFNGDWITKLEDQWIGVVGKS
jgi:hypothetical protein